MTKYFCITYKLLHKHSDSLSITLSKSSLKHNVHAGHTPDNIAIHMVTKNNANVHT